MIQDIAPSRLINRFEHLAPSADSAVLCFQDNALLIAYDEKRHSLCFPLYSDYPERVSPVYLFKLDDRPFFLIPDKAPVPVGFAFHSMQEIRSLPLNGNADIFAVYSAYHLYKWYKANRFCGACGERTQHDTVERALYCPACGNKVYPRINPAVIIGVTNGNQLLLTKYRTGFAHNALVAGFTEFGETLEETVAREVMEEVGLRVKNIRYYKSQPWGIADDILAGFYCEAEEGQEIRLDTDELRSAVWQTPEEITGQPDNLSLTNEMMIYFKEFGGNAGA